MMKRLIQFLFPVFLLAGSSLHSQTVTFQQELDMPGEAAMQNSHLGTYDGGMMSLISSFNSATMVQSLTFIKTTAAGNIQWTKRFSPLQPDFKNFVQATDSGYFLCYHDYATPSGTYQALKLNSSGNVLFSNQLTVPAPYAIVGQPEAVAKNDGGFYVVSDLFDTVTSLYLWHVFEISSTGNVLWSHCYNVNAEKSYHAAIDTCQNGDIVLAGTRFDPATSLHSTVLTRLVPGGPELWTRYYDAPGREIGAVSLTCMPGDYFMLLGGSWDPVTLLDQIMLMKTDGQGNELWTFTFSNNQNGLVPISLARGENNTSLILGMTGTDGVLIKTDTAGMMLCKRAYPGTVFLSVDTLAGSVDSFLGNNPLFPVWILMTTDQCGVGCADTSVSAIKTPLALQSAPTGANLAVSLTETANTLPGVSALVHVTEICSTIGMDEPIGNSRQNVYPVPASDVVHVQSSETVLSVELVDITGKITRTTTINSTSFDLNVSDLAEGIYFLRIHGENETSSRKIIIQH